MVLHKHVGPDNQESKIEHPLQACMTRMVPGNHMGLDGS